MTLIKSISGIRGTIGGKVGYNLTPIDAVKFASAYGTFLKKKTGKENLTVVIGRDARISGPMIHNLVVNTLVGLGIDVIDLGLSTRSCSTDGKGRWRYYSYGFSQSKTMECAKIIK